MGMWNATCGLSQLPIRGGDRVVALFLRSQRGRLPWEDVCEVTNLYYPVTLPFTGVANAYGALACADEDWNTKIIADAFDRAVEEKEYKLGAFSKEAYKDKTEHSSHFLRVVTAVERGSVGVKLLIPEGVPKTHKRHYTEPRGLMLFMAHEGVWKSMQQINPPLNKYTQQYIQEAEATLDRSYTHFSKLKSTSEDLADALGETYMDLYSTLYANLGLYSSGPLSIYKALFGIDSLPKNQRVEGKASLFFTGSASPESFPAFKACILELATVSRALVTLRRGWAPQFGKGSQCEFWRVHRALHEAVIKQIDIKIAEDKANGCDYEEEEG